MIKASFSGSFPWWKHSQIPLKTKHAGQTIQSGNMPAFVSNTPFSGKHVCWRELTSANAEKYVTEP
jgi:hypothetical protein